MPCSALSFGFLCSELKTKLTLEPSMSVHGCLFLIGFNAVTEQLWCSSTLCWNDKLLLVEYNIKILRTTSHIPQMRTIFFKTDSQLKQNIALYLSS